MPEVLYNNADDGEGRGNAKTRREAQRSGGNTAWSRWSRLTAVCEMLLCVLLLTAVTVLWINYHILKTENTSQTCNNNLTIAREQFQREREQFQREREQFQREREQFQREREQFQRERDELERFLKLGWIYSSSSVYIITTELKSWTESRQNCRERGADLVIINSTEEQEFVTKLRGGGVQAWIGLRGRDIENKWKWVDDTPLITGFWGSGQPDSKAGAEDCVIAGETSHPVNNWGDDPCNKQYNWICEKTIFN